MPTEEQWSPSGAPPELVHVRGEDDWQYLAERYGGDRIMANVDPGLRRVLEIAAEHGTRSVLIEPRYVDLDWRAELATFYSSTFRRHPQVAHRLHFFKADLDDAVEDPIDVLQGAYLGYSVMRPLPERPVGRTVLAPPPGLRPCRLAQIEDPVHVFGRRLTASGAPFIQQDGQLSRCAQASMWMVLYHLYRGHGGRRISPADIHESALPASSVGRRVPSPGLTQMQMAYGLEELGAPPDLLDTDTLAREKDFMHVVPTVCRYVNSNLIPVVSSNEHAWVVVGYREHPPTSFTRHFKQRRAANITRTELVYHDDELGPYQLGAIFDPRQGKAAPDSIQYVLTPRPFKSYIGGSTAELRGRYFAQWMGDEPYDDRRVSYRTYMVRSNRFLAELASRGIPPEALLDYRRAVWPRFIWVVELVDRRARWRGEPDVVGEVVFDATAHQRTVWGDEGVLAFREPGRLRMVNPDDIRDVKDTVFSHVGLVPTGSPCRSLG